MHTHTIGVHYSIAKGFAHAAERVLELGCNTFQLFSRNPRGSSVKMLQEKDLQRFHQICRENAIGPVLAHAPYTMNLAGVKPEVYEFGCRVLSEDVARMNEAGIPLFNLHPGSHTQAGVEAGTGRIIAALNPVLSRDEQILILLETMSGSGSEIGGRFEELRAIIDGVENKERLGVCMDLCHVFAAGYDIVHDLDGVLGEFDQIIGLDRLKAIHLNDSMMAFGIHKDRHAPIGEGQIGMEAICRILWHPLLRHLPFYLETPLEDEGHKQEVALLRQQLALTAPE